MERTKKREKEEDHAHMHHAHAPHASCTHHMHAHHASRHARFTHGHNTIPSPQHHHIILTPSPIPFPHHPHIIPSFHHSIIPFIIPIPSSHHSIIPSHIPSPTLLFILQRRKQKTGRIGGLEGLSPSLGMSPPFPIPQTITHSYTNPPFSPFS
jgi:hypothetical protein